MEIKDDAAYRARATASIARVRLAVGLVQGVLGWLLLGLVGPNHYTYVARSHVSAADWASRHPVMFACLSLTTAYVPLIAISAVGRMRRGTLALYVGVAGVVVAGLAAYDLWRDPSEPWGVDAGLRVWPSFTVCFCTGLGLFIVNQLLEHRERGDKLFAHYAHHFEDSWMRAFQLVLSCIFALLVWALLELGAELFHVIGLDWFRTMIRHNWFRCPALAVAFAAAVHITDVRPALLRGVRNVCLTLLSWLLPLVVTLGAGFLVALMLVGAKPLWATRHASSILLWASAIGVMLLNAAYKDGDPSNLPPAVLRWTARLAGPVVLSLAVLASYALGLRVYEHGWTPERVFGTTVAFMVLVYGAGYTYASVDRSRWLAPLEKVNVTASLIILGILALLLSPVADPARLSVNSQLRRLMSGETTPGRFDYDFLRFASGRFGKDALARLTNDPNSDVRGRAIRMLQSNSRSFPAPNEPVPALTEPAFSHASIYPKSASLPDDFKATDFTKTIQSVPDCVRNGTPCDIYVLPYGAPGDAAIIVGPRVVTSTIQNGGVYFSGQVFQRDQGGQWIITGDLSGMMCANMVDALREGRVATVRPEYDDLSIDGSRIRFHPVAPPGSCVKEAAGNSSGPPVKAGDSGAPVRMGPAFGKP